MSYLRLADEAQRAASPGRRAYSDMFWSFAEGGTTAELECGLCIRRGNVTCHALPFPLSLDLDAYRVLGSGP